MLLCFLCFLGRLRFLTQKFAREDDRANLTAADFSLHLSGLRTDLLATELALGGEAFTHGLLGLG